jgi:hypothetical protein
MIENREIRPIAIYLPQFHPIPENDAAWGEGFTEWTNVKKAKPLFEGHYQPHVPHDDVDYYDLRDPEILVKQAAMAKEYGIYGFAFYHYWFNGKRLLNLPLDNMLKSGKPDFPFCFIWANEPWSRRWDGSEQEIIQEQTYSFKDDVNHIQFLCENVFSDKRYIKINGRPLFIVYRTELLPNIKKTAEIWRNEVKKYGFEDIYLVRVEHFTGGIEPLSINFDAAMEFAPYAVNTEHVQLKYRNAVLHYSCDNYKEIVANMIAKPYFYKIFRCVFPAWDNTPRKKHNIYFVSDISTDLFSYFVHRTSEYTCNNLKREEQFFFINAWNEWGEGCHVEPDKKNGYKYLEAIKKGCSNNNISAEKDYYEFIEQDRYDLLLKKKNMEHTLAAIYSSKILSFTILTLKRLSQLKRTLKRLKVKIFNN